MFESEVEHQYLFDPAVDSCVWRIIRVPKHPKYVQHISFYDQLSTANQPILHFL